MNTLYMKIVGFEQTSGSLLVSFASDTTAHQNPEMYPAFAFQPSSMWPDITDPNEIKKRIATSGVWHAEQQEREEKLKADPERLSAFQELVGTEASYDKEELISTKLPASAAVNVVVV